MSNNKQSSVEFLWKQLKPLLPDMYSVDESVKILSILKQAKAMHKEEIKNSYITGFGANLHQLETYYNEKFGGNNG